MHVWHKKFNLMLIMIKIIYTLDDILDSTLCYLSHYAIWDAALIKILLSICHIMLHLNFY